MFGDSKGKANSQNVIRNLKVIVGCFLVNAEKELILTSQLPRRGYLMGGGMVVPFSSQCHGKPTGDAWLRL
jgi:hypothetical protein